MRCPACGYLPALGRPKKLNDPTVARLRERGWSMPKIAEHLHVTTSAIAASLKRHKPAKKK